MTSDELQKTTDAACRSIMKGMPDNFRAILTIVEHRPGGGSHAATTSDIDPVKSIEVMRAYIKRLELHIATATPRSKPCK